MNAKENGNNYVQLEPISDGVDGRAHYSSEVVSQYPLTKRELFAAMAMQGFCARENLIPFKQNEVAEASLLIANALLEALAKPVEVAP